MFSLQIYYLLKSINQRSLYNILLQDILEGVPMPHSSQYQGSHKYYGTCSITQLPYDSPQLCHLLTSLQQETDV